MGRDVICNYIICVETETRITTQGAMSIKEAKELLTETLHHFKAKRGYIYPQTARAKRTIGQDYIVVEI